MPDYDLAWGQIMARRRRVGEGGGGGGIGEDVYLPLARDRSRSPRMSCRCSLRLHNRTDRISALRLPGDDERTKRRK